LTGRPAMTCLTPSTNLLHDTESPRGATRMLCGLILLNIRPKRIWYLCTIFVFMGKPWRWAKLFIYFLIFFGSIAQSPFHADGDISSLYTYIYVYTDYIKCPPGTFPTKNRRYPPFHSETVKPSRTAIVCACGEVMSGVQRAWK